MTSKRIPVHMIITGVYFLGALVTLVPMETASKTCLPGVQGSVLLFPNQHPRLARAGWSSHLPTLSETCSQKTQQ